MLPKVQAAVEFARSGQGRSALITTVYLRDENQQPIGIFSINYDITLMLDGLHLLLLGHEGGGLAHPLHALLDELVQQVGHVLGDGLRVYQ